MALQLREVSYVDPLVTALTNDVQAYYTEIYGGPDTSPVSIDEFAAPNGRFLVGLVDGQAAVMGGWRFHLGRVDIAATRPAEIKRMYVVTTARGRGFARQMLAALEASARQAGADAMVLETGTAQPDAIALYRSSGYQVLPPFGYYADEPNSVHLGRLL